MLASLTYTSHKFFIFSFANRIFIIYELVQVLAHLSSHIELHRHGTFTFSCSHTFTYAHGIYIHFCAFHIYLDICMTHWQDCEKTYILTCTLHLHMQLYMHTNITHCTLSLHIYNQSIHITSPGAIVGSHVKHTFILHTLTHTLHNLYTCFSPLTHIFMT